MEAVQLQVWIAGAETENELMVSSSNQQADQRTKHSGCREDLEELDHKQNECQFQCVLSERERPN